MITDDQRHKLQFIGQQYGVMINIAAGRYHHRPEVLVGIMMRETEGGLSRLLDLPGPAGRGDREVRQLPNGMVKIVYHGHGLMQIDDRSFPDFCRTDDWKDPQANILFGASVLALKRAYLKSRLLGFAITDDEMERLSICAYNCGEGTVYKAVIAKEDPDGKTAHGNYALFVLKFAVVYVELAKAEERLAWELGT